MTSQSCECCDVMQLVRDHLREIQADAVKDRAVYQQVHQLLEMVQICVKECNKLHKYKRAVQPKPAMHNPADVPGQMVLPTARTVYKPTNELERYFDAVDDTPPRRANGEAR